MKVLLWETSAVPWGVGVAEVDAGKGTLLSFVEDDGQRTLARQLMQSVDRVLTDAHCQLSDIDSCAVSLGPGSWTGLRIGLTAAKTIAQSLNLPIIGIPTFDIFAQAMQQPREENILLVHSPCRPGELYAKLWHCQASGLGAADAERNLLEAERVGSYSEINSRLEFWMNELSVSAVVTNTPEQKVDEPLRKALTIPIEYRKSTFKERLQAFAYLSEGRLKNGPADSVLQIQPIYLAPSAAEREYNAKHRRK